MDLSGLFDVLEAAIEYEISLVVTLGLMVMIMFMVKMFIDKFTVVMDEYKKDRTTIVEEVRSSYKSRIEHQDIIIKELRRK